MVARRIIPAFLVALAVASLMTWLLSRRMVRPVAAATLVMDHLVAPAKPMNVGDTLDAGSLQLVQWPGNAEPQGSFKRQADLVGRVLLVPVAAGQPILNTYLAAPGTGAGLLAKIPAGMRAVSVQADAIASVSGFVTPDSFVDILVTTRGLSDGPATTACVLQDVRVLAVGGKADVEAATGAAKALNNAADSLTLLLSNDDAIKLAQGVAHGKVQFLLRNGADRGLVRVTALEGKQQAASVHAALPAAAPARAPVAAPSSTYSVETVAGTKQTSESFEGKTR